MSAQNLSNLQEQSVIMEESTVKEMLALKMDVKRKEK